MTSLDAASTITHPWLGVTGNDAPLKPMLIDGEWVEARMAESAISHPHPAGTVIARVPYAGRADVNAAVAVARAASPVWRAEHFVERQRLLLQIADAIEARTEEFASLTALDTGNAIRTQARPEVGSLVDLFRFFAGVAGEAKGVISLPVTSNCNTRGESRWGSSGRSCLGTPPSQSQVQGPGCIGGRQHRRSQGRRRCAADHLAARGGLQRVPSARRVERAHGRRSHDR